MRFANCPIDGAAYSPIPNMISARVTPARPTVLTAMRAVPRLTVYQAVTSDYTGYPGNEIELPFSGADFLATEPYNSGGGNPVILNSTPGGTEIGLAFPSGIAIHLFVGADHRILREVATTPNHLITSTFEYPPNRR